MNATSDNGPNGMSVTSPSGVTNETSESDDTSTSGDTGDLSETGDVPIAGCIVDDALARPLAVTNTDLAQVHLFEPGADPLVLSVALPDGIEAEPIISTAARADFIAVATSYSIYQNSDYNVGAVVRLFERGTGALLWSWEFADYGVARLFVDAQGRVTAGVSWSPEPAPAGLLFVGGDVTVFPNYAPVGPIGSSGWIPVRVYDGLEVDLLATGFYHPTEEQFIEVTTGSTGSGWRVVDESIEYVDNDAAIPRFVVANPDGEESIELTQFAETDTLVNTDGIAGDYRLLVADSPVFGDNSQRIVVRLDLSAEIVTQIDVAPPSNLFPFDCHTPHNGIDADGRVLFEFRDDTSAQVHAWDPDAEIWTALGVPLAGVDDIIIEQSFGRVQQIQGKGPNTTYCYTHMWADPPPMALEETSTHLARVDPPLSIEVDRVGFEPINVDSGEHCATWLSEQGQRVVDLDDGDTILVPVAGQVLWLD